MCYQSEWAFKHQNCGLKLNQSIMAICTCPYLPNNAVYPTLPPQQQGENSRAEFSSPVAAMFFFDKPIQSSQITMRKKKNYLAMGVSKPTLVGSSHES
jgi:hypothetical protein